MRYVLPIFLALAVFSANASEQIRVDGLSPNFSVAHKPQGTGNWKGKRDKHQKAKPQNERKKKSSSWVPHQK